ncbi:hypothetical protein NA56DRAFT_712851 [Hyaloscypha hepaticicola]|uniref:Uncharacterized protein n=1 Tax=Hyaloscypha hepaticicola TaxID=2082293 RepID=A0A2J6PF56_9HELO|nr:hypothetical protein NA56DRAFT_712851 [Hyaloscypha hepaticicola]
MPPRKRVAGTSCTSISQFPPFYQDTGRVLGYELFIAISTYIEPLPVFSSWAEHKMEVRVPLDAHCTLVAACSVLMRGKLSFFQQLCFEHGTFQLQVAYSIMLFNIVAAVTLTAYWTVESLFMGVLEIRIFTDKCFDEVMLLFVLYVVFICLAETQLTDPLSHGLNPHVYRLPTITTPVYTTIDFKF